MEEEDAHPYPFPISPLLLPFFLITGTNPNQSQRRKRSTSWYLAVSVNNNSKILTSQTCVNGLLFQFPQFPCSIFTLWLVNCRNTFFLAGINVLKLFLQMGGVAEIEVTIIIFLAEGCLYNFQLSNAVISKSKEIWLQLSGYKVEYYKVYVAWSLIILLL